MSMSFVFYLVSCAACYKLGVFNTKHPGELAALTKGGTTRCWRWMNQ